MNGRSRRASNTVHHTEPSGGSPGRLWTVYLIHTPTGAEGLTARR